MRFLDSTPEEDAIVDAAMREIEHGRFVRERMEAAFVHPQLPENLVVPHKPVNYIPKGDRINVGDLTIVDTPEGTDAANETELRSGPISMVMRKAGTESAEVSEDERMVG